MKIETMYGSIFLVVTLGSGCALRAGVDARSSGSSGEARAPATSSRSAPLESRPTKAAYVTSNPCQPGDPGFEGLKSFLRKMNGRYGWIAEYQDKCESEANVMELFSVDWERDYCGVSTAHVGVASSVIGTAVDELISICKSDGAGHLQADVMPRLSQIVVRPNHPARFGANAGVLTVETDGNSYANGMKAHISALGE